MSNSVKTVKLSDEAREVVERATVAADRVKLPDGRLDPKIYKEIAKTFEVMGGKWNKKEQAHLFTKDPRADIKKLISNEAIVDVKKTTQAYYTPADIAEQVADELGITNGSTVLEPSAGHGALAEAAKARGANVICCEIDNLSCGVLTNKGFNPWNGDFLMLADRISALAGPFDFIIMNPPFNKQQDIQHALRAYHMLKPGGKMACVMTKAYQTSKFKLAAEFRKLLELVEYHRVVQLPVFEGSGSGVAPVCVIITKAK